MESSTADPKASSLRWAILRLAFLRRSSQNPNEESQTGFKRVSRKAGGRFNLIPSQLVNEENRLAMAATSPSRGSRDCCVCYTLPLTNSPKLFLIQRAEDHVDLNDFEICRKYNIDNTGLVCPWPSEDVLAYFCLSNADVFRSKRVIELGSGYGLAGFVVASALEAAEVVISDGNPQVVDYIQRNIDGNTAAFGFTKVKSLLLHWNQEELSNLRDTFDVIIASDCTFFEEFHTGLAQTVKTLLTREGPSEAIFLSPKRGNSLSKFLEELKKIGLQYSMSENYDAAVWRRHQSFVNGDDTWPNYEQDHCYPLLVKITL